MRSNEPRIYGPYEHGDQWRVHYVTRRPDGTRKTEYSTHASRAAAEAEITGARDEAQGVTVKASVDRFLAWKRDKGCAETTITNYTFRLERLLDLAANGMRPLGWTRTRGDELYKASVYGAGDTHINGLNVGRMWGAFLVKSKLARANPFANVEAIGKRNRGSGKSRLTVNESRKLEAYCFAHAGDPYAVLTYGYLMLGKRASELVGITVRDLDDDGWLLRISKAKTEASIGSIGVSAELRDMLMGLAKGKPQDVRLFTNLSGGILTRHTAYARVRAVLAAAEVPVLSPQALRRTFTDNASRQGVSLHSIAKMAGHTSTAVTTRSYMAPEQAEAAAVERNFRVLAGGRS